MASTASWSIGLLRRSSTIAAFVKIGFGFSGLAAPVVGIAGLVIGLFGLTWGWALLAGAVVYFFFSVEHRGTVGAVSRAGILFLMVGFGASFGYTVMGRITLLIGRFQFLFHDWLGLGGGG